MSLCYIFRFEQFLLLPQCFQKLFAADVSKCIYSWERVNEQFLPNLQTFHIFAKYFSKSPAADLSYVRKRLEPCHQHSLYSYACITVVGISAIILPSYFYSVPTRKHILMQVRLTTLLILVLFHNYTYIQKDFPCFCLLKI